MIYVQLKQYCFIRAPCHLHPVTPEAATRLSEAGWF